MIDASQHIAPPRITALRLAAPRNATLRLSRRFCAGMAGKPFNRASPRNAAPRSASRRTASLRFATLTIKGNETCKPQ
jgi:hypothetical protein